MNIDQFSTDHWNTKHQWFVRELIALSVERTVADAIGEWDFGGCREAETSTHCQGCHTPLRWVTTLTNRFTQARLLIDSVCYANFLVFLKAEGIISESLLSQQKHDQNIREHFQQVFLGLPCHARFVGKKIIAAVTGKMGSAPILSLIKFLNICHVRELT